MIELCGNAIRVTAGDDSPIAAIIRNVDGTAITEGDVRLVVPELDLDIQGVYENNVWNFEIPDGKPKGRYMYHFQYNGIYLNFESAIYFV